MSEVFGNVLPPVVLPTEIPVPLNSASETEPMTEPVRDTTRHVAYTEKTTEERICSTPSAQCIDDGVSGSDMDSSSISPLHYQTAFHMERLQLPNSLHGMSLRGPHPEKLLEERVEVISRKPMEVHESPVESNTSSVTFLSTSGTSQSDVQQTQTMTKSAKKRMRKKRTQQRKNGSACLSLPCMQPATRQSNSLSLSAVDHQTPTPQKKDSTFLEHLNVLLSEDVPVVDLRFQEQGIRNLGSTCFLASAIQFLLGCSEFCWLMSEMGAIRRFLDQQSYPVVCSLGSLASSLQIKRPQRRRSTDPKSIRLGVIVPDMLASVVKKFQLKADEEGNMNGQDVHEFLLFLLDQTEQELIDLKQRFHNQTRDAMSCCCENQNDDDDGSWLMVGKKNKVSIQRTTGTIESSILSSVFGGWIQSEVRAAGMVSSITTNPFMILELDIVPPSIHSIGDALDFYTERNSVPDYRVSGCQQTTIATKINLFKKLPRILLLCLIQYTFNGSSMEKQHKHLTIQPVLHFKRNWLTPEERPCNYRLLATCNHHGFGKGGKQTTHPCFVASVCDNVGDHYTANVLQEGDRWLNFNDSTFERIHSDDVRDNGTPYLLLYGRL